MIIRKSFDFQESFRAFSSEKYYPVTVFSRHIKRRIRRVVFFQAYFQAFCQDFLEADYFKFGIVLAGLQQLDVIGNADHSFTRTLDFLFHRNTLLFTQGCGKEKSASHPHSNLGTGIPDKEYGETRHIGVPQPAFPCRKITSFKFETLAVVFTLL